jgi:hypothetical protein
VKSEKGMSRKVGSSDSSYLLVRAFAGVKEFQQCEIFGSFMASNTSSYALAPVTWLSYLGGKVKAYPTRSKNNALIVTNILSPASGKP